MNARDSFSQFVKQVSGFSNPNFSKWADIVDRQKRAVIWKHAEAGATMFVILRIVWELGNDPALRIGVLASTRAQGDMILAEVARLIRDNEAVREAFPKLALLPRGVMESIRVKGSERRHNGDPSVFAFGQGGGTLGRRFDLLFGDNFLDPDSTWTKEGRKRVSSWFSASVLTRLTASARVFLFEGTYHKADLAHSLVRDNGWASFKFPVLESVAARVYRSTTPGLWPASRIQACKTELGEKEFARRMMCRLIRG
jgi:hypothetical protein